LLSPYPRVEKGNTMEVNPPAESTPPHNVVHPEVAVSHSACAGHRAKDATWLELELGSWHLPVRVALLLVALACTAISVVTDAIARLLLAATRCRIVYREDD